MTEAVKEAGIKQYIGKMWQHTKDIPKEIEAYKKHTPNVSKAKDVLAKSKQTGKGLHPNIAKGGLNLQKNLRGEHVSNIKKGLVIPAAGVIGAGGLVEGGVVLHDEFVDGNPTVVKQAQMQPSFTGGGQLMDMAVLSTYMKKQKAKDVKVTKEKAKDLEKEAASMKAVWEGLKDTPGDLWRATKNFKGNAKYLIKNEKEISKTKKALQGLNTPEIENSLKESLKARKMARVGAASELAFGAAIPAAGVAAVGGTYELAKHHEKKAGVMSAIKAGAKDLVASTKTIGTAAKGVVENNRAAGEYLAKGDKEMAQVLKQHRNNDIVRVAKGAVIPATAGAAIGGLVVMSSNSELSKKAELAAYTMFEKHAGVMSFAKGLWKDTKGLGESIKDIGKYNKEMKAAKGLGETGAKDYNIAKGVRNEAIKYTARGLAIPAAGVAAIGGTAALATSGKEKKAELAAYTMLEKSAGISAVARDLWESTKGLGGSMKALKDSGKKLYSAASEAAQAGKGGMEFGRSSVGQALGADFRSKAKDVAKGLAIPAAGVATAGAGAYGIHKMTEKKAAVSGKDVAIMGGGALALAGMGGVIGLAANHDRKKIINDAVTEMKKSEKTAACKCGKCADCKKAAKEMPKEMPKKAELALISMVEKDAQLMTGLKAVGKDLLGAASGEAKGLLGATKGLGGSFKSLGQGIKDYGWAKGVSGSVGVADRAAAKQMMINSGKQIAKGMALPAAGAVGTYGIGKAVFGNNN